MAAAYSSETWLPTNETTARYVPEVYCSPLTTQWLYPHIYRYEIRDLKGQITPYPNRLTWSVPGLSPQRYMRPVHVEFSVDKAVVDCFPPRIWFTAINITPPILHAQSVAEILVYHARNIILAIECALKYREHGPFLDC